MSTSLINGLTNPYVQSALNNAIQDVGLTNKSNNTNGTSLLSQPDNGQLSPFAQLLSTLQQLEQSDPTKYQQVTQQIATNLQSAAQTAQSQGNTNAASQLNQLATDFTTASQNGQLPNIQDLAKAVGGAHGHHHHHHASADADGDNDGSANNQMLGTLLSALQNYNAQSNPLDPMAIITNTLSSAGITTTS